MAWIELHQELRLHPKVMRLASELGCSRLEATGILVNLWMWVMQYYPTGDVTRMNEAEFKMACDVQLDGLLDALIRSEWVDRDVTVTTVHDWHKHGMRFLKMQAERQKKYRGNSSESPRGDVTVTRTQPNPTQPKQTDTDTQPPPVVDNRKDIEGLLLAQWGRDGRMGWGVLQQFADLSMKHGWKLLQYAVKEAATHNRKSFAYVRAICEKRAKKATPKSSNSELKPVMIHCADCQTDHLDTDECPHWKEAPAPGADPAFDAAVMKDLNRIAPVTTP